MNRVLHIRSSSGFFGAESVLVTLLKRLPHYGTQPTLVTVENYITGNTDLLERAHQFGIPVSELPCSSRWSFSTQKALNSMVKQQMPHCIHTHDYKSHVLGFLASRSSGLPIVATLHGWISNTINSRIYQALERRLLRYFDAIITVSPTMTSRLYKWKLPESKLFTIANGVDTDEFSPIVSPAGRGEWGLDVEDFIFCTVGRLSREKGQEILVKAFARVLNQHRHAKLLIVGEGPDRESLRDLVIELGVEEATVFAGKRCDIPCILQAIDCYVSPSITEGMPMIVLEAMASARPIVATRVGAVGELLDGGAGTLVPAENELDLSQAMSAVIKREVDLTAISKVARKRCLERYSAERQAEAYGQVYDGICR